MRKLVVVALLATIGFSAQAQIGGKRTFGFLEMPVGAKMAAIGGVNVTSPGSEAFMANANPALLSEEMDGKMWFNHTWFLAGVRQNNLAYVFNTSHNGRWGLGLDHLNYGTLTETDPTGAVLGQFSASDYAFRVTHARTVDHFTMGATAKLAVSSIAGQSAMGALVDVGGIFKHPEHDFQVGLALRNIGYQFKTFPTSDREPMPFDAQLGMSYKLEHMPLRFSLTAHRLYQWDIVYLDPNKKSNQLDANNEEVKEKKTVGDQFLRHFVVGGEFLLSKSINFRVGYNHLRRRELRLEEKAGGAGFSLGGNIRTKNFELGFTKSFYHVSGSTTYLTVAANVGSMFGKPKKDEVSWPQDGGQ